ncbi:MAG: hypothetical protein P1U37_14290 [Minwuia sp.]|nr:hypothetical protein [Minwuia sp.]
MTHRGASFASPTRPVIVDAPSALLDLTRAQAPCWPEAGDLKEPASVTALTTGTGEVRFTASSYDAPDVLLPPGLLAANGLIGTVIGAFVAADPDWICLHAAAIALGPDEQAGLTVLLGDTMAGKSTLALALADRGARLWCDDRLPVSRDLDGLALGLRPKLRLPLPENAPAGFATFVESRGGAREGSMVYLALEPQIQAAFGAVLPIRRLVTLERSRQPQAPRLKQTGIGEMVKNLVPVTFAPHLEPVARLARLRHLATECACHHLSYDDSFEAAAFLMQGQGE